MLGERLQLVALCTEMIAISGCRRSGTSLWMQILGAAGLPIVGDRFPEDWEATLGELNPAGFWESKHRNGIEDESVTQLAGKVIKVFVHGLLTTDVAHLEKVVLTIRPWREHVASVERFEAVESAARERTVPQAMPPALEWWYETYCALGDVSERGYPAMLVAYDTILEHPVDTIERVLAFLDVGGDAAAARTAVRPELRTQRAPAIEEAPIEPDVVSAFDEFYDRVRTRRGFDGFEKQLNDTHARLWPLIAPHLSAPDD